MQQTVDTLKDGVDNTTADISDEDLRQLVIYYATFVRNPKNNSKPVLDAWNRWPKDLWNRFNKMVIDESNRTFDQTDRPFWVRPATVNIQYGIDA
jgi:hypothetical protein